MIESTYDLRAEESYFVFKFTSTGPKGSVEKIVLYTETDVADNFNLAFGDLNEAGDDFDDFAVTGNQDTLKVLGTVASTLFPFFSYNPGATVIAAGSTPARNRLYRTYISPYLNEFSEKFAIFGYSEKGEWEDFNPCNDYQAFSIRVRQKWYLS
jgi:hypothetical protein